MGHLWSVFGRLGVVLDGLIGTSCAVWASCGVLERPRTSWRRLGAVLGHLGGVLGAASLGVLEVSWGALNYFPQVLEPSQRRLGTKNQPQRPKATLNGFLSYAFLH